MIIAVDLDEVVWPLVPELLQWHNAQYDSSLKLADFTSYKFWEIWGGTRGQAIEKYFEYFFSAWADSVKPITGAVETLIRLKQADNLLYAVTSRQNELIDVTEQRLNRDCPDIFSDIAFGNHYSKQGGQISKAIYCQNLKAEMLIDDSPAYLVECSGIVEDLVLFGNYPWNQDLPSGAVRAEDWFRISELVLTRE